MFGGGEGVEGFLEHRAGQGVEGEPAVDLAVAVVPHGQPGRGGGVAFLAFEQFGFVGVGGVGGGDLEDVPAQLLEGFGVVVGGECRAGAARPCRVMSGSRSSGSSVRARRMASACSTWTRPSASAARVGSWLCRPLASRIARCAAGGWSGSGGRASSRSRWRRCCRRCRSGRRGPGARAFSSASWASARLDVGDRGGGLGGVHRPHRDPGHRGELIAHAGDRPGDRVRLVRDRCHGPIPAPPTDPRAGPESPCGQGIPEAQLWTESGFRRGVAGVSRRSLRDLLNHRGTRSQPTGGNPIASPSFCASARPSRTRSASDCLDGRAEAQTLAVGLPHPTTGPIGATSPTTERAEAPSTAGPAVVLFRRGWCGDIG